MAANLGGSLIDPREPKVYLLDVRLPWFSVSRALTTFGCNGAMHRFLIRSILRWVSVPLAIAVSASTAKSLVAGPWWIFAMLLGVAALIGWTIVLLASLLRSVVGQNWKRAALLSLAFVSSFPLIFVGMVSGDYVHLALMYPYYAVEIRRHPDWQSKEVRFDWGDEAVTALDGLRARVLIYDASGKVVVGDRYDPNFRLNIQHLIGNFYLAVYSSD